AARGMRERRVRSLAGRPRFAFGGLPGGESLLERCLNLRRCLGGDPLFDVLRADAAKHSDDGIKLAHGDPGLKPRVVRLCASSAVPAIASLVIDVYGDCSA